MNRATLMIAASEHDADMLYISRIFVPDAFIAIGLNGVWHGLFSPLEVDRARKNSAFDEVHLDTPWREKARENGWQPGMAATAAAFLRSHNVNRITVPAHFPLGYAEELRKFGFSVEAAGEPMFDSRIIKSETEIAHLAKVERLTRRSMQQAERFLAECRIENDASLSHASISGKVRAEHLRAVIETFLVKNGAMPAHTIVACGRQGADPHNVGRGPLKAYLPIIVDIFPRDLTTGYWGDMTRTYVKGRASPEVKKLYRTVREGQDIGLAMIGDGVAGADIHRAITDHFDACGFPTGIRRGKQCGFFHGTGHGVGLEIHEAPRISTAEDVLRAGQVVTVEPGLYYHGMGGVRIEDMVVVRNKGHTNLTCHSRRLEID